jgi:hypothetical protein
MHSSLASASQPYPLSRYAVFTAELASTFNQALLLDNMLKRAKSDEEPLYYLGFALEGIRTTFLTGISSKWVAPAFPEERRTFTGSNEEAARRLRLDGSLNLPSSARFRLPQRFRRRHRWHNGLLYVLSP